MSRESRNSATKLIKDGKLSYYSSLGSKLSDPNIGLKHLWSAYKKISQ